MGADIQERERLLAKANKVGICRTAANPHDLRRAQIPRPRMLDEIDLSHAALSEEQPHHVLIADEFPGLVRLPHDARLGRVRPCPLRGCAALARRLIMA